MTFFALQSNFSILLHFDVRITKKIHYVNIQPKVFDILRKLLLSLSVLENYELMGIFLKVITFANPKTMIQKIEQSIKTKLSSFASTTLKIRISFELNLRFSSKLVVCQLQTIFSKENIL